MADRWIDVSVFQDPNQMRWSDWHIPRGQCRRIWGPFLDVTFPFHRKNMRSVGMLTGSYGVPHEGYPIADQAWKWADNIPADDENDDWVDAERARLTEPMLWAYCQSYETHSARHRLAIYTNYPWWTSHVPIPERIKYKDWPLIIAAYPFDSPPGIIPPMDAISVARRSNPPVGREPTLPPPWTQYSGWQHSGQASFVGYPKFLDAGIYRVNPGPAVPVPNPAPEIKKRTAEIRSLVGV